MARAWIAIGSNLGDRSGYLAAARRSLVATPGVHQVIAGMAEETAPLGGLEQPMYLNQMLLLETSLDPRALLDRCHAIEREAGRERAAKWGSRTLDLDLVRHGDTLCDRPDLTLPHPGLRDRTFWAREIAELETHVRSPAVAF
jgi:2-amino-4-hydroxy-6-hydroxymethyldihydropteridine diphosphokinase